MSRSRILIATLLVLLFVTFIMAADTSTPAAKPDIAIQTEKQQAANTVNNTPAQAAATTASAENSITSTTKQEEPVTVEDGKLKQQEQAAPVKEQPKEDKAEVNKDEQQEVIADEAWVERPFSLLNALNEQFERNSRVFRRSLWDDFEDSFDNGFFNSRHIDDDNDDFYGGNSLLARVFGNNLRRRAHSPFESLFGGRRRNNFLNRRPAFYLNRLFRDDDVKEHATEHKECNCANKKTVTADVKKDIPTATPVEQAAAVKNDVAAAQPTLPVLKRVKSEWSEDKDNYSIKLQIPEGIYAKDQIKIQVKPYASDKEMIVISGENKEKQSSFEKSFVFQKAIDSDKMKAKYENNTLKVEVAKKPHVENVKQISIE